MFGPSMSDLPDPVMWPWPASDGADRQADTVTAIWNTGFAAGIAAAEKVCRDRAVHHENKPHPSTWGDGGSINWRDLQAEADACADEISALKPPASGENKTMTKLTKLEVAAMWFFHADYAKQRIGAVEYFKRLSPSNKRLITDMVKAITEAEPASGGAEK